MKPSRLIRETHRDKILETILEGRAFFGEPLRGVIKALEERRRLDRGNYLRLFSHALEKRIGKSVMEGDNLHLFWWERYSDEIDDIFRNEDSIKRFSDECFTPTLKGWLQSERA